MPVTAQELRNNPPKAVEEASNRLVDEQRELRDLREVLMDKGKLKREQRSRFSALQRSIAKDLKLVTRHGDKVVKAQQREDERRRRDAERVQARDRARGERKRKQLTAKSRRKACYAQLPAKAKPSQAVKKGDGNRYSGPSSIEHALLTREGRGDKARWVLVCTDSYRLVRIPLEVSDERAVKRNVLIPVEALKAIEKAGAFRITSKGAIQPLKVERTYANMPGGILPPGTYSYYECWVATEQGTGYMPPDAKQVGQFPKYLQLVPKEPAKKNEIVVKVDAALLASTAKALGGTSGNVELRIAQSQLVRLGDGRRTTTKGILVRNGGTPDGVVMPCDVTKAAV